MPTTGVDLLCDFLPPPQGCKSFFPVGPRFFSGNRSASLGTGPVRGVAQRRASDELQATARASNESRGVSLTVGFWGPDRRGHPDNQGVTQTAKAKSRHKTSMCRFFCLAIILHRSRTTEMSPLPFSVSLIPDACIFYSSSRRHGRLIGCESQPTRLDWPRPN